MTTIPSSARFALNLLSHAQQTPHKTALICAQQQWDYAQLAERACQIANALCALGLDQAPVLLNLPKQPDTVAAIYACWLSGNHYIPIDYSQPEARVERIIAAAKPALVLDQDWLNTLDSLGHSNDYEHDLAAYMSRLRQHRETDIAAILYTSGSTGTPKGVQISHDMLDFFIDWAVDAIRVDSEDTLANHASFAFDLSTFDLFAAARTGACVWLITEQEQKDTLALIRGIKKHQVSIWYSVPSILSMMARSGELNKSHTATLKQVIFAGEPFVVAALQRLLTCLPASTRLHNWYGPTETNVCVAWEVDRAQLSELRHLPIGALLPGLEGWLIDESGAQTPLSESLGKSGELLIGGRCVTPGYANVALPRAAAFHQQQCHATGDLVELNEDGLVYRGRIDDMVKLNGYRVELGEIESLLHQHPAIEQAALHLAQDELQHKLIALITLKDGTEKPSLLALKQHLKQQLPAYMLPHKVVVTEQLPLNANGKVDRKRLAEWV
ncbi:D-alanine--poly(phosphoribitol) ligase [Pseudoalteromonas rubra]|uniref:Alanine-phosphoribitol ligase n=1 Tax=Pseudoalteromonas rubra TaxID=43658 RepID=A0A0F4QKB2_9GAMM|nr:D-alanine--poly(phosphoribitol) ligase [Pseudoalteromonas rubra]KJZ07715.1 alanine-phosphoribitol ligase [Pseudoalteromonas rubra]